MMDDKPQAETGTSTFDARVLQKRYAVFFRHSSGNMSSFLIGAFFLFLVMWMYGTAASRLYFWLTLVVIMVAITFLQEYAVAKRNGNSPSPSREWVRTRLVLGGINALVYGITPLLLPTGVDPAAELYLFIILSTLVTVASVSYSTIPKFIYILGLFSMGPLTIYYFMIADQFHLILGLTAVAWTVVVLNKAAAVSRTSISQIMDRERLKDEIKQHEKVKQQIKEMAHYDLLTGIANRRLLESMINQSIQRARREEGKIGFIIIDLDDFKPINDHYGHQAGDAILKNVASSLTRAVRASDMVARIGGDEFCIILHDKVEADAIPALLQKLSEAISQPIIFDGHEISVSASLGYSQLPDDGETMDSLMQAADLRMYESKRERKLIPVHEF